MKQKTLIFLGIIFFIGFSAGYFLGNFDFKEEKSNQTYLDISEVEDIIDYNMNLSYTQQIFQNCSVRENESEQLLCVNKYTIYNYKNVPREEVYTIDDMFDKGADCKSYSIYYATLAKMMGYDYAFFTTPNHIMTLVYFEKGYCILDQKIGECFYYEENLKNTNLTVD